MQQLLLLSKSLKHGVHAVISSRIPISLDVGVQFVEFGTRLLVTIWD
jgi:hypothetical protein